MIDIYLVTNTVNEKKYVGQASWGFEKRWSAHRSFAKTGGDDYLHRAMRKYGIENFKIELIEAVDTLEKSNERETFWINYYDSRNPEFGYNIREGGSNGKLAESTKQKIAVAHTGLKLPEFTEGHKQGISEGLKKRWEENPWKTFEYRSEEDKQKISEGLVDYHASMSSEEKELREEKLRQAAKEQFSTEESREAHSKIMLEWSKNRTPEQKAATSLKRSESLKRYHARKKAEAQ